MLTPELARSVSEGTIALAAGVTVVAVTWRRAGAHRLARRSMRYLRGSISDGSSATPRRPAGDATASGWPVAAIFPSAAERHGVHIYRTDDEIVGSVAGALEAAIGAGDAILVVAGRDHRVAVEAALRTAGVSPDPGAYLALDAEGTLDSLLVEGELDSARFRSVIGSVVGRFAAGRPGVTIYGEMVGLLWSRGQVMSAMRLEGFWNELGAEVAFSLLCGYRADESMDQWDVDDVHRCHSHVVPSPMR